jgi:hypothetical protein
MELLGEMIRALEELRFKCDVQYRDDQGSQNSMLD